METSTKDPEILLRKLSCKWVNAGVVAGLKSLGCSNCHSRADRVMLQCWEEGLQAAHAQGQELTDTAGHRTGHCVGLYATQNSSPLPQKQQHSAKHHPAPTSYSAPNYSFPPGFPLLTTVLYFSPLRSSVPNPPSSSQAVTRSWWLQGIHVLPFPEGTLPTLPQSFAEGERWAARRAESL